MDQDESEKFEAERGRAMAAWDSRQALQIDGRLVAIGLGKMGRVRVAGPGWFAIEVNDSSWSDVTLQDLLAISRAFSTECVRVELDADQGQIEVIVQHAPLER